MSAGALRRLALYSLIAYVVVQLGFLGLAELAARIVYPSVKALDSAIPAVLHRGATPALTLGFLALTLAGTAVGNVVGTAGFGWLLLRARGPLHAQALVLAMVGVGCLEVVSKLVIQRARPEVFRLAAATGYSFPSGHALAATCLYGFLALALWRVARGWGRVGLVAVAVAIPCLIGLSRVYLGVHYPSDVLGGWAAGGLWLAAVSAALEFAGRRRAAPGGARFDSGAAHP